jgi:hypothetical protein
MASLFSRAHCILALAGVSFSGSAVAQPLAGDERRMAEEAAVEFLNEAFPSAIELYFLETEDDEQSLALRYDWSSSRQWEDDGLAESASGDGDVRFDTGAYSAFIRGNYVDDEDVNPSELSEIGASWNRRWFHVFAENRLETGGTDSQQLQLCVLNNPDFEADDCRALLGMPPLQMSYTYVDVDGHVKIEGDQQFDARHYVYGVQSSFSRTLGTQRLIIHPILTAGIEQVYPENDSAREALLADDESYSRVYAQVEFTGVLGTVDGHPIKYSFSYRYFQEVSPETAIEDANLDTFAYRALVLRLPAALLPGFDNEKNSFVLTYSEGELPFNRSSEQSVELGFRHDIDFGEFF